MSRSKYASEEERKAAKREYMKEYNKRYRETHKEQNAAYQAAYYASHRQRLVQNRANGHNISAFGYEVLSVEEMEQLSKAPTDMSERVIKDMDVDFTVEYQNQFKQLLSGHTPTDEDLDKAWKLARSSVCVNSKRGYLFESVMRKNILYELRMKQQKLYSQIPINKNKCKIDFALSNEVLEDKRKLDITQAVIISTKTSLKDRWREDMHLYSSCKAYIMVTLDDKCPTEELPDNVYFCSPHYISNGTNIINLNDLLPTVMEYLEPEDTDADTNADTEADTDTDTNEASDATEQ